MIKPTSTSQLPTPKGYAKRCEDKTGYITPVGKLPSVTTILRETKSGKAKVTALIRGMGSPTTYGVEVPRQAMLRELGLH